MWYIQGEDVHENDQLSIRRLVISRVKGRGREREEGEQHRGGIQGDLDKNLMFYFISRMAITYRFLFLFVITSCVSKISD